MNKLFYSLLFVVVVSIFNTATASVLDHTPTTASASSATSVAQLLSTPESYLNKSVTLESVCTHICKHGAKKMFLMGDDESQIIRIQAGELGSFDKKCLNSMVKVTGTLKETKVTPEDVDKMEARMKEAAKSDNKSHGAGHSCSNDSKANGEKATTQEGRIAELRTKIAERNQKSGKNYLSYYFVEASEYEVL